MTKESNILITGVGGQGVILMSELLGKAAVADGLKVRGSEALGMAVRGGSVTSSVRLGDDVYGPLIPTGKCDILVGMEPSEALRNIACLSKSSLVLLNTAATVPFTVFVGESSYPSLEDILEKLGKASGRIVQMDAVKTAQTAGSSQTKLWQRRLPTSSRVSNPAPSAGKIRSTPSLRPLSLPRGAGNAWYIPRSLYSDCWGSPASGSFTA